MVEVNDKIEKKNNSQDNPKREKENRIIRLIVYLIIICVVIFLINKLVVFIILSNEKNANTSNATIGIVLEDNTKMKSSFGDSFKLSRGEHISILEEDGNYYKVKYNNRVGKINKELIDYYKFKNSKNYVLMADVSGFNFKEGTFKKIEDFELFIIENNISYVYIRLGGRGYGSEGILYDDSYCQGYVDACENLKIPYGFYFIDEALNNEEVDGEIEYINKLLEGKNLNMNKLPFAIDIEYNRGSGRGDNLWEERVPVIQYFIDQLKSKNIDSIVYANALRASTYLTDLNGKFWLAYYPQTGTLPKKWYSKTNQEAADNKILMDKTVAWQFSENGAILEGIKGMVDLSVVKNSFFLEAIK